MSRRISRERPLAVVTVQCWVGAAMLAGFSSSVALHPGRHWFWLVGLGVIHSGVVYVLFYSAYRAPACGSDRGGLPSSIRW